MSVIVNWSSFTSPGASGYTVKRYDGPTGTGTATQLTTVGPSVFTYTDTTAAADTIYSYVVEANTPLGAVKSPVMVGVALAQYNGPFKKTLTAGNLNTGMMEYLAYPAGINLRSAGEAIAKSFTNQPGTSYRETYETVVPGYNAYDLVKCVSAGKVFFMCADYGIRTVAANVAQRNSMEAMLRTAITSNITFSYEGYSLQWDLITLDEYQTFYTQLYGGAPTNAGFVPRSVDKPIPAYTGHYVYARSGTNLVRVFTSDVRPYPITSSAIAADADAFTAVNSYPIWVARPS